MPFHNKKVYERSDPQGVSASGSGLGGQWTTHGTESESEQLTGGLGGATQVTKVVDLREYSEGFKSMEPTAYSSGSSLGTNKGVFNYIGNRFYKGSRLDSLPIAQLKKDLARETSLKVDLDYEVNITLKTMDNFGLVDLV